MSNADSPRSSNTPNSQEPRNASRRALRIPKACSRCRQRKQRCSGPAHGKPKQPCPRCVRIGADCSFTWDEPKGNGDHQSHGGRLADDTKTLERMIHDHEARIKDLEGALSETLAASALQDMTEHTIGMVPLSTDASSRSDQTETASSAMRASDGEERLAKDMMPSTQIQHPPFQDTSRMNNSPGTSPINPVPTINLDTPISTLQRLRRMDQGGAVHRGIQDPIHCNIFNIFTMEQAQHAFDVFFINCHRWAPVLCPKSQRSAASTWVRSPTLFVSVCAVGFRFTKMLSWNSYEALVSILDASLSRLLLRPTADNVNLDNIRSILLYIQWMPMDCANKDAMPTTRYNDISAWSMLGLAIRYALALELQTKAVEPFVQEHVITATTEDICRLRVWINILTCDANLMLSSGRPASLNPEPVAAVARSFMSHRSSSQPDDTRAAAVCELVAILKRTAKTSGKFNIRSLDPASLRQINVEFDAWEREWSHIIGSDIQHSEMPFTTLRAYRSSINSACLTTFLSTSWESKAISIHMLHALEVSLTATTQTLLALSNQSRWQTWQSEFTDKCAVPDGPLTANQHAANRLSYSVDSSSITFTFAVVFITICYRCGVIDDDTAIIALERSRPSGVTYPGRPRLGSKLCNLLSLATEIIGIICDDSRWSHPLMEYREKLEKLLSAFTQDDQGQVVVQASEPHTFEGELSGLFETLANDLDFSIFTN